MRAAPLSAPAAPVPVIMFDGPNAELAFAAYAKLKKAQAAEPALKDHPYWQALTDAAFARFYVAFEVA